MTTTLVLLTLVSIGATLLGGILLGMILHYFWYAHDSSAGIGRLRNTHQDALRQIDELVNYAIGAHDHIAKRVDEAEQGRGRRR